MTTFDEEFGPRQRGIAEIVHEMILLQIQQPNSILNCDSRDYAYQRYIACAREMDIYYGKGVSSELNLNGRIIYPRHEEEKFVSKPRPGNSEN